MVKEKVLELLENSSEFISGQYICENLGVSRTAIWKAVATLKKEGYIIEAVTNKGYRLLEKCDILNETELKKEFENRNLDIIPLFKSKVDSTNKWAKEIAENKDFSKILCVADEQVSGRGRRGRVWSSPAGSGIWMSLLIKPDIPTEKASMLTLIFALSVANAIRDNENLEVLIKWPNDIVYNGKKICGILTEMSSDTDGIRYIICGIGINANTSTFSPDIKKIATSIRLETGKKCIRSKLIAEIFTNFNKLYLHFQKDRNLAFIKEDYEKLLVNKGKTVYISEINRKFEAICKGINDNGELLVIRDNKQEEIILSGEVSVRGIYGYV